MAERILRRVGVVLFLSGLLDLLLLAVQIATHTSYHGGWFLLGMVGGVLFYRGSLRTASVARQIGAFLIVVEVIGSLIISFLQRIGLLVVRIKQTPISMFTDEARVTIEVVLLVWVICQLDRVAIRSAMVAAGRKRPRLRIAAFAGRVFVLSIVGLQEGINHSAAAAHARLLAKEQAGPNYRYYVQSLHLHWENDTQSGHATVDAWNDAEFRQVIVT